MAGIGDPFFLSDGMIGLINRPTPAKISLLVIFTYHLAHFLIVAAVIQLPGYLKQKNQLLHLLITKI